MGKSSFTERTTPGDYQKNSCRNIVEKVLGGQDFSQILQSGSNIKQKRSRLIQEITRRFGGERKQGDLVEGSEIHDSESGTTVITDFQVVSENHQFGKITIQILKMRIKE